MTATLGKPSALDAVALEIAEKTQAILTARMAQATESEKMAARLAERPALRLEEAAQLLGLSRQFLARFVHNGELPTAQLGNAVRLILREDLDNWLRSKRDGAGQS